MSEMRAELAPAFPSEKEEDEVNNPPALVVRQISVISVLSVRQNEINNNKLKYSQTND